MSQFGLAPGADLPVARPSPAPSDLEDFVARLGSVATLLEPTTKPWFEVGPAIAVARAPGRLDVMGGIADYSGSLVLQWPIQEAALAAVQISTTPGLVAASLDPAVPSPSSLRLVAIDSPTLDRLLAAPYDEVRRHFAADPGQHWAAYVAGVPIVLARERGLRASGGIRILIDSRVPEGKGVSSSAALEVAVMRAWLALLEVELDAAELARLCQMVENLVVGAPCGIMDQMTSALGQAHALLALLCQPAIVQGTIALPPTIAFWGIDSGIRHAVSGSDYSSVRTGAFMGYRIIAELAGLRVRKTAEETVTIDDSRWSGYLANLTPEEFDRDFAPRLPERMLGSVFLDRYGGTTDPVTRVDPDRIYPIREPTAHPVREHARVRRFAKLLQSPAKDQELEEMGRLMAESHASYSACGLGSQGTDLLVELVRQAGPAEGLFGAKITGGGSGGTVAILGRSDAGPAVARVARTYQELTGRVPVLFQGSSPGACWVPPRRIHLPPQP
jgi:galactokinase